MSPASEHRWLPDWHPAAWMALIGTAIAILAGGCIGILNGAGILVSALWVIVGLGCEAVCAAGLWAMIEYA